MGGGQAKIWKLGGKKEEEAYTRFQIIKRRIRFYKLLKHIKYDVVYLHMGGNGATLLAELCIAKAHKVPKIIVHSHTTQMSAARESKNTKYKLALHEILKNFWPLNEVTYLACSKEAAMWAFPKLKENEYKIIRYGIDISKYLYNPIVEQRLKDKYGWKDKKIILNVSRLVPQKNHTFILDVFSEIYKKDKDAILICVGEGELREKLEKKAKGLGLEESVIFVGEIYNPEDYYNVSDVFLFPSLYEGLGIVLIEAQINGIPIVASSNIPTIAKVTDLVDFISLEEDKTIWCEHVMRALSKGRDSESYKKIKNEGWDMEDVSIQMRDIMGI